MICRIILLSLCLISSSSSNAMDDNKEASDKKDDGTETYRKRILELEQKLVTIHSDQNSLPTPEKLKQYAELVKFIGAYAIDINALYRLFLKDQARDESEKATRLEKHKKNLDTLRENGDIIYNIYWANQCTRSSYVTHPAFAELLEKVKFAQEETKEIESELKPDNRKNLFRSGLLLSIHMNAFCEIVVSLKAS